MKNLASGENNFSGIHEELGLYWQNMVLWDLKTFWGVGTWRLEETGGTDMAEDILEELRLMM